MLQVREPDEHVLDGAFEAPGGFAWWYADVLDDHGNGVVAIPSWGLPFLPGRTSAARRGAAVAALERPGLALSVYEGGREAFYLLQELPADQAGHDGHEVRFGRSLFAFRNGGLQASIDLDVPGGRLRGELVVDGVARQTSATHGEALTHEAHEWCPLVGPASGRWDLTVGEARFVGEGTGYVDRNAGLDHFQALGIHRWVWARAQLSDRLRIGYCLWPEQGEPEAVIVDVMGDGALRTHRAQVQPGPVVRNRYGLPWWDGWRLDAGPLRFDLSLQHRPDEGPSYLRALGTVDTEVGQAPALTEMCDASRLDLPWQRPFLDMVLHRPHGRNSLFLPLFGGPRRGRVRRLLLP